MIRLSCAALALSALPLCFADDIAPKKNDDRTPKNVSLSDSPEAALKKFAVTPGLEIEVWASEPLLANPVAFSFDHRGRAFVAETYRRRSSVPDIRKNEEWTIDNLALRTVEDRIAYLKAHRSESARTKPTNSLPDLNADGQFDWRDWAIESEQVRMVTDSNGDGRADTSSVFASGFNSLATGVGAGVVAHDDAVFFTCTPDLWRLDGEKEGAAEAKTALHSGFGVHIAYSGHDMHGAKIGLDGRLYWTIADCGAHLTTKEGRVLDNPDSGAVFRCNLDGSNLELFCTGLRNPQSLAFNDVGDLFTGDNNADGGDKARWEQVVEGGDYGWRIGWQFLPKLGPWNSEGMWHLDNDEKNLAVLPPVGHIGHGPAGIAYYPGTGLPETFQNHFFYADFPGGVRHFALKEKGASYTVDNPKDVLMNNAAQVMAGKTVWGLFPSDVGFAPGGGVYVLDWVQGWEKTGKGRIFRLFDRSVDATPLVQETRRLLNEGFRERTEEDLVGWLGHADQRVRMGAQFELVRRADTKPLVVAALAKGTRLSRLHAIWGVGQLARQKPDVVQPLMPLALDTDDEVRAQWAKCIGEARFQDQADLVARLLEDSSARVRFFAAQTLGQIGYAKAAPALAKLASSSKSDPFLRHAAVLALVRCGGVDEAVKAGGEVALLALRRAKSPAAATFLDQPALALEAARAIHDAEIPEAWPQLAALVDRLDLPEPLSRRVLNTNYLLGNPDAAMALGRLASNAASPKTARLFAIELLGAWNEPFGRDRVTGLWRKLAPRSDARGAQEAAKAVIEALLADKDEAIQLAACDMAGKLKLQSAEATLISLVSGTANRGSVRASALKALLALKSGQLASVVDVALRDKDGELLEVARQVAESVSPALAVRVNAAVLGKAGTREQQEALATIARQPVAEADEIILAQLELLSSGNLPKSLWLDVLEAAALREAPAVKARLAAYELTRSNSDPLAAWRECLEGGDSKLGRTIFLEKAEAACMRCHRVKGEGGDVGPELTGIAKTRDREYLLRSIVDPNGMIAPGYENVMLTLDDGKTIVAGLLSGEDAEALSIKSLVDGSVQKVVKARVKDRLTVPSAMPPGLGEVLGKRGLRDVVEFLAKLK